MVKETGNPNHSGIYRTTNTKTGSVSYRGQFNRRNEGGVKVTPSRSTIKEARTDLNEAMKNIPKGKSIMNQKKKLKKRNLLARLLRSPLFRARSLPNKKLYNRKKQLEIT